MKKKYPYSEGDDYYTINNSDIIWSCWDDVSEELHTKDKIYFDSIQDAKQYMVQNKISVGKIYDYEK